MGKPRKWGWALVKPARRVATALAALILTPGVVPAAEPGKRDAWWAVVELGGGYVDLSGPVKELDDTFTGFYLALAGGYALSPHLLIGVEASGWLRESGNLYDSSEGEAVSPIFAVLRFYPSAEESGLYLKAGGGYVHHWNNASGAADGTGWGATGGIGYDFHVQSFFSLSPFLAYTYGELKYDNLPPHSDDNGEFHAITAGVCFVFY
jgi:hypothetical protein